MSLPSLIMFKSVLHVMENKTFKVNNQKRNQIILMKHSKTQKQQRYVAQFGIRVFNKLKMQNKNKTSIKKYFTDNVFYTFKEFFD